MDLKSKKIRLGVQIIFFITVLLIAVNHKFGIISFIGEKSLHGVCPFGGVVSIYTFVTEGNFVQKIHESSFVVMYIVLALSILFGPVFCGWVCSLGSFQEWMGKIGKKIFKNKYNNFVPYFIDKYLRYFRYLVLAWVLYITAVSGKLLFKDIDPYHALFNFWSGEVPIQALVLLVIIIIASLLIERPWCKYACPFGAVLGISNLFRIFKVKRNKNTCVNCDKCLKACPMNIKVQQKETIRNHQCISCLKCTSEEACPIENTVNFSSKGGE